MANTISYATIFQQELDKAFEAGALTGWMDQNAGLVKYTGGSEVKIPKLALDGLGNYDRDAGYPDGAVTLTYETMTMRQDRGRRFYLDAMDVDETSFAATAGAVMGEFQRLKVVPEVDAYRMAALCEAAGDNRSTYTPAAGTVLSKLLGDIAAVEDRVGTDVPLYIHISTAAKAMLEQSTEISKRLEVGDFMRGEMHVQVKTLDGHPLIAMPSGRMYSKITILDGRTASDGELNQAAGGYAKAADGVDINWVVVASTAPIGVCKTDTVRVFDPLTTQKANAWQLDYRKYHDLWVPENAKAGIQVNLGAK